MIVSPRTAHSFRLLVIRNNVVVVRELFIAGRTDPALFDDLPVHQFPHLCRRSQLPIPSGVVGVLYALNPESYDLGFRKDISATASARSVNWAEFVGTESHDTSPVVLGGCEGVSASKTAKRAGTTQTSAVWQSVFDRIAMGWESRSSCRISATPSCAGISPRTWSTHSVGDKANGACLLRDHGRLRTGTCGWKDRTGLNGLISSRPVPASTSPRRYAHLF